MQSDAAKYLYDMRAAVELIEQFTSERSLADYRSGILLRSAVERQFQVLGEALSQLTQRHAAVAQRITDHRRIINLRHILVHGYDRINDDVVWGIIEAG